MGDARMGRYTLYTVGRANNPLWVLNMESLQQPIVVGAVAVLTTVVLSPLLTQLFGAVVYVLLAAALLMGLVAVYEAYKIIRQAKREVKHLEDLKTARSAEGDTWKAAREVLEREYRRSDRKRIISPGLFLTDVCGMPFSIASEIGEIIELLLRDFILNWFDKIGSDQRFVDDIRIMTLSTIVELSRRCSKVNIPVIIATDGGEAVRHHLMWYKEISKRVAAKHAPRVVMGSINDSFYADRNRLVEAAFRQEGRMHTACESEETELLYLRHVSNEILARILPAADYKCSMVRHLLRECVAVTVALPIVHSVDPDFFNWAIEELFAKYSTVGGAATIGAEARGNSGESSGSGRHPRMSARQDALDEQSMRYFAGAMSPKMAEKYLKSMPAGTFLIRRRDKWSSRSFVVSSVGYASRQQPHRQQAVNSGTDSSRSRSTSAPMIAASLQPKLKVLHWAVEQIEETLKMLNTNGYVELEQSSSKASGPDPSVTGTSMSDILKKMKTHFMIGLRFVDGEVPVPEFLPWCTAGKLTEKALPKSTLIFVKQKDSPIYAPADAAGQREPAGIEGIFATQERVDMGLVSFDDQYIKRRASYLSNNDLDVPDPCSNATPSRSAVQKRQQLQRQQLLQELENAISIAQAEYSGERQNDRLERFDRSVRLVIDALESVLSYGLKTSMDQSNRYGYWAYVSQVSKVLPDSDMIVTMIDHMPNSSVIADEGFWEKKSSDHEDFENSESEEEEPGGGADEAVVDTYQESLGKGRAFVVVGLNKEFLAEYLNALITEPNGTVGPAHYEDHSIIRSPKDSRYLIAQLETLGAIEFNINIDDAWDRGDAVDDEEFREAARAKHEGKLLNAGSDVNRRRSGGEVIGNTKRKISKQVDKMMKQLTTLNLFGDRKRHKQRKMQQYQNSVSSVKSESARTLLSEETTSRASGALRSFSFVEGRERRLFDSSDILGFASADASSIKTLSGISESLDVDEGSAKRIGRSAKIDSQKSVSKKEQAAGQMANQNALDTTVPETMTNSLSSAVPPALPKRLGSGRKTSVWIGPNSSAEKGLNNDSVVVEETVRVNIDWQNLDSPIVLILRAKVTKASVEVKEKSVSIFQNSLPHVEYHINVESTVTAAGKEISMNNWEITRRYRLFFQLHCALKRECKLRVSLPPKQMTLFSSGKYEKRFLETRRGALNTYLHELLAHPEASMSTFLLAFLEVPKNVKHWGKIALKILERQDGSIPQLVSSNTTALSKKKEGPRSPPRGQNSLQKMNQQARGSQRELDSSSKTPSKELFADQLTTILEVEKVEHHMYALAREIFETDDLSVLRRNFISALKGLATVTMKGSAYSIVNDAFSHLAETSKIGATVKWLKDYLWPNGEWGEAAELRSIEQMNISRTASRQLLLQAIPESLMKLFSKDKCIHGVETLHDFLQCDILLKNLVYTLLDMILIRLFPDISVVGLHQLRRGV